MIIDRLDFTPGNITVLDTVDSTNSELKRNAAIFPPWSAVCSYKQTSGRGRKGHSFLSPEGGLYFSVSVPLGARDSDPAVITSCAGVCVADAIEKLTGITPEIKWVNDVMIRGKKVCGILCEGVVDAQNRISSVVCGVGINLTEPEGGFDSVIAEKAGALSQFCDPPEPDLLIAEIINGLHSFSPDFLPERFIDRYRALSCVIGKSVTLIRGDADTDALVAAINDDASLTVEYPDGTMETVRSGEVSIKYQRRTK